MLTVWLTATLIAAVLTEVALFIVLIFAARTLRTIHNDRLELLEMNVAYLSERCHNHPGMMS